MTGMGDRLPVLRRGARPGLTPGPGGVGLRAALQLCQAFLHGRQFLLQVRGFLL